WHAAHTRAEPLLGRVHPRIEASRLGALRIATRLRWIAAGCRPLWIASGLALLSRGRLPLRLRLSDAGRSSPRPARRAAATPGIGADDGLATALEGVVAVAHRRSSMIAQRSSCMPGQSPEKCSPMLCAVENSGHSGE